MHRLLHTARVCDMRRLVFEAHTAVCRGCALADPRLQLVYRLVCRMQVDQQAAACRNLPIASASVCAVPTCSV